MTRARNNTVDFSGLRALEDKEEEQILAMWLTNLHEDVTVEREALRAAALANQSAFTASNPDPLTVLDNTRLVAKRLFKSMTTKEHKIRPPKPYQGLTLHQQRVLKFANSICWDIALIRRSRKLAPHDD